MPTGCSSQAALVSSECSLSTSPAVIKHPWSCSRACWVFCRAASSTSGGQAGLFPSLHPASLSPCVPAVPPNLLPEQCADLSIHHPPCWVMGKMAKQEKPWTLGRLFSRGSIQLGPCKEAAENPSPAQERPSAGAAGEIWPSHPQPQPGAEVLGAGELPPDPACLGHIPAPGLSFAHRLFSSSTAGSPDTSGLAHGLCFLLRAESCASKAKLLPYPSPF